MDDDDEVVRVCRQDIVKLDLKIKAKIQDIQECEGPLELLQDINKDIQNLVGKAKSRIKELETLAKEQDKETDQILLLKEADNHRKHLASTQVTLRQVNLECHLAIERKGRDILFAGTTGTQQRQKSNKEGLAKSSSGVTEQLLSLSRSMSSQLQQSDKTMNSLVSSSQHVSGTHEEFKSMSSHIQSSRKLLTKFDRRECTDKLLIILALVFFLATVLYIVKKRILGTYISPDSSSSAHSGL